MADKYINSTGLLAIKQWIEGKFALDADLDTLDAKVDSIIAEGGEPNTIESISVNGTTVAPDAQKNVALTVPTATADLTNNGDGTDSNSPFATQAYVAANGGKIDTISVNNTPQTITNKNVNITVPTKVSDLTNDGDGTAGSEFATKSYVDQNGGKIDKILVNGSEIEIIDKQADIATTKIYEEGKGYILINSEHPLETGGMQFFAVDDALNVTLSGEDDGETPPQPWTVQKSLVTKSYVDTQLGTKADTSAIPTAVSDLTNDSGYQTASDVQSAISTAVASAYKYKGSVATQSALPASGQAAGDVWDVQDTGVNYAWTGTAWDALGSYVDTSVLWTSTTGQTNTLEAMTVAEVNAILNPSA